MKRIVLKDVDQFECLKMILAFDDSASLIRDRNYCFKTYDDTCYYFLKITSLFHINELRQVLITIGDIYNNMIIFVYCDDTDVIDTIREIYGEYCENNF